MKRFAALFAELDATTSTLDKVSALRRYVESAPPADAAWALFFMTGRRLKRLVSRTTLWEALRRGSNLPDWLLGECYDAVGDSAEVSSLLMEGRGHGSAADRPLHVWLEEHLLPMRPLPDPEKVELILKWWNEVGQEQLFILNKVLTGAFRVGVAQTLVERALAEASGLSPSTIAHRLMGTWEPTASWYQGLLAKGGGEEDLSRPYPFYLASPLEEPADRFDELLGDIAEWQAEWKWDGIRAQLIRRGAHVHLWSRGEELITERFPEVIHAAARLPEGVVLDGEVLAFASGRPLPFSALQQRIGRKKLTDRVLEQSPVVFMAYDLLELDGQDRRESPMVERRRMLEAIVRELPQLTSPSERAPTFAPSLFGEDEEQCVQDSPASTCRIRVSETLTATSWQDLATQRAESRSQGVEGVMLKRLTSSYGVGRRKGDWWKWKIDPYTVDAVLVHAQPGSGRRASLLTDYTFAVWDRGELVPFAKAYSGLSNEEIRRLDAWLRGHTLEKFGPVRVVEPVQVFELGFEAIAPSTRHKSGVAVRFPRMLRWRTDKPAAEADTLDQLRALIRSHSSSP